jgi:flagellar biosynthesis/type III secretory pathway M-ring protein FliF/YscJ
LADGALPTQAEMNRFLVTAAIVIFTAIVVLILLVRAIAIALRRRADRPAEPADPAVPTARVVQDRSKPS